MKRSGICSNVAQVRGGNHQDRDEVKARAEADFLHLYMDQGGRRRGKALHCIFHKDRTPSASIHKGRFHCFVCNLHLDVFEFITRAQRCDFKSALSYLADHYAVPLNNRVLTAAERRDYARQRAEAECIRLEALYFTDAARLMTELALEELPDNHPERQEHTTLLESLKVSPDAEYRDWLQHRPVWAAALVHAGRARQRRLQHVLAGYLEVLHAA
jgi:hypothetical protein